MRPFAELIEQSKKRKVVLPDVYYGEMQGLARALSFSIKGVAVMAVLVAIKQSLDDAIANGISFEAWKQSVIDDGIDFGLSNNRLDNIFKTNIQTAYNRGRCQRMHETNVRARFPYLLYDSRNDSRVRPSHLAYDGFVAHYSDAIWNTIMPPNGYRCRCKVFPLSEKEAKIRMAAYEVKKRNNPEITGAIAPDDGWDYNPCEDIFSGIDKSFTNLDSKAGSFFRRISRVILDNINRFKGIFANQGGG